MPRLQVAALCVGAAFAGAVSVPTVTLKNAAVAGVEMPIVGAGTGGYTGTNMVYAQYPPAECFNACDDPMCITPDPLNFTLTSCEKFVQASVSTWIQLGGRRIDGSASYHNQRYVTLAMNASGVPRADFFLTSKVGPFLTMGFNESLEQFASVLGSDPAGFLGGYVDLLLVHWPSCASGGGCTTSPPSSDPPCAWGAPTYDERACRLSTWRALVQLWRAGAARAIGVSNYNSTHLQEIVDAGLPLPAVNQIPYFLYHSSVQDDTVAWCSAHGVLVNGYSPFGVPDHRTFVPPAARTPLADPVAGAIAAAHGVSPAALQLAWQGALGLVVNPRSMNAGHMLENLGRPLAGGGPWWALQLSPAEVAQLSARPQQ